MLYQGSCHCGAVAYEVQAPAVLEVEDCNCSICSKSGIVQLIVPATAFRLLRGESVLASYRFNTGVACHRFCSICGVKAFYIPRSNPDGVSVNVYCLEPPPEELRIVAFDGRNWEANAGRLAHKSRPG